MSRRNLRFAMMMALTLPAQLPLVASAQPRNRIGGQPAVDPLQKWANSGYGYCDAKILGALWGTDTYEAKKTVGRKLGWGNADVVKSELQRARKNAMRNPAAACSYHEAGFNYADAEALGRMWRVEPAQAKKMIERKVLHGGEPQLRKMLARQAAAPQPQPGVPGRRTGPQLPVRPEQAAIEGFFAAGLGYCDAKLLGAMWRTPVGEAKVLAGYAALGGGRKTVAGQLDAARKLAARTRTGGCTFAEAGFSAADAQALARLWNVDVRTATAQAEQKLLWGNEDSLREMIQRGQPRAR